MVLCYGSPSKQIRLVRYPLPLSSKPSISFLLCDAEAGTATFISFTPLSAGVFYGCANTRPYRESGRQEEGEGTSFWCLVSAGIIPQLFSTLPTPATPNPLRCASSWATPTGQSDPSLQSLSSQAAHHPRPSPALQGASPELLVLFILPLSCDCPWVTSAFSFALSDFQHVWNQFLV